METQRPDLAEHIGIVMELDPGANALWFEGQWWTWAQLTKAGDDVLRLAGGDATTPFTLVMHNSPAVVATVLAAWRKTVPFAILDPLSTDRALAEEIAALRPASVVAVPEVWSGAEFPNAVRALGALGLCLPSAQGEAPRVEVERGSVSSPYRVPEGTALSMLTSGTTGKPKRINIPPEDLLSSVTGALRQVKRSIEPPTALRAGVNAVVLSIAHHGALVYGVLMTVFEGRAIALLGRFDPTRWAELVYEHKVVSGSLPPAAIKLVLDADIPPEMLRSLRALRAGTAPLPSEVADAFESRFGIPVLNGYGATELGGVSSLTLEDRRRFGVAVRASVGRPNPGVAARIVDPETRAELPAGTSGLLEVRKVDPDPGDWISTNDSAHIDEHGFIYIEGRADDVIIRGGFKISVGDLEAEIRRHPEVSEVAIVGLDDQRLGSVPGAMVVPRAGATLTAGALETWLRERIPAFQIPTQIVLADALPRGNSMKVLRGEVRARLLSSPTPAEERSTDSGGGGTGASGGDRDTLMTETAG